MRGSLGGSSKITSSACRWGAWLTGCLYSIAAAAQSLTFVPGPSVTLPEIINTGSPRGGTLNWISADLTGDGRRDLLLGVGSFPPLGKQTLPMRVLRPNADGTGLADVTRQLFGNGALPSSQHPREFAIADFNRDGKPDIFVADHGYDASPFDGATNLLLLSNADGTYSDRSSTLPQVPDFTHNVAVGDIDGDGFLDIYVGNVFGSRRIGPYFLMGGPNGSFTQSTAGLPTTLVNLSERYHVSSLVDVNGDGFPDLVLGVTGYDTPDNVVLINDGTGDFTKRPRIVLPRGAFGAVSTVDDIVPMDVNGDGRPDLLVLSTQSAALQDQGAALQLLMNRDGSSFVDESATRLGPNASRTNGGWWVFLRIVDINGDGLPDIFATGSVRDPTLSVPMVWLNKGNGTFTPVNNTSIVATNEFGPFELVDIDNDGRLDIVTPYLPEDGKIGYHSYLNRTPRTGPRDYSDMWWAGSAENGWGMSVQQHLNGVQFNALYVYDAQGRPVWYVMPGGTWGNNFTTYSGALYFPTGSPLNNFVSSQVVVGAPVGTITITYTSLNTARIDYTINGTTGSKTVQRLLFGAPDFRYASVLDFSGAPSYRYPRMVGDMWWGGDAESGWGVSLAQQFRTLFSVWYTYGTDRRPAWFVMSGGTWLDDLYSGDLYSTNASGWLGVPYDPASFTVTRVGTGRLGFTSNAAGVLHYTFSAGPFAGTSQSKPIVRQPY